MRTAPALPPSRPFAFSRLLVLGIGLVGLAAAACNDSGPPPESVADFGAERADASPPPDESPLLPRLTYNGEIQPLLAAKCAKCHSVGGSSPVGIAFVDSYAEVQKASKYCLEFTVGVCIGRAIAQQQAEGTGCRTYLPPYHRDGWKCLDEAERMQIAGWVAGGLLER